MTGPRFSMDQVVEAYASSDLGIEKTDTGIAVKDPDGETYVSVEDASASTFDGIPIIQIARVRRPIPQLAGPLPPDFVHRWNRYASYVTLFAGSEEEAPFLEAKFPLLDGDPDAALDLYPWLARVAVHMAGATAFFLRIGPPDANTFLSEGTHPPPSFFGLGEPKYVRGEYESGLAYAFEWASERGLRTTRGASWVCVEFPWTNDPRVRPPPGSPTSLLIVRASEYHPLFGPGLGALLQLPVRVSTDQLGDCVDGLNEWERKFADLPPSIGSWIKGSRTWPAWSCFLPTGGARRDMAKALVWWTGVRVGQAAVWWAANSDTYSAEGD